MRIPDATPCTVEAECNKDCNRYLEYIFFSGLGVKDSPILAIYSHMVNSPSVPGKLLIRTCDSVPD